MKKLFSLQEKKMFIEIKKKKKNRCNGFRVIAIVDVECSNKI